MANLSERLRTSLEQMATSCSVGMGIWDKHSNAVLEAASALDRLTVEGLAGVMRELVREQSEGEWDDAMINADADKFTRRLLTYITGESHD